MIGIESDSVSAAVIGDTADIGCGVLLIDAACLACSRCAEQVRYLNVSVLGLISLIQKLLSKRINVP